MKFKIKTDEFYEEYINITFKDTYIHTNTCTFTYYNDEDIYINRNFDMQDIKLRKDKNNNIFLIPSANKCFDPRYVYSFMMFTNKEFNKLWKALKLDPVADLKIIKYLTIEEIFLTWAIQSKYRNFETSINEYLKNLFREIIACSIDSINIEGIFEKYRSSKNYEIVTIKKHRKVELYLDNSNISVWNALAITKDNEILFKLNDKKYLKLI